MKCAKLVMIPLIMITAVVHAEWNPDLGNGMYQNPIIFADYSDPDVIRVNDDYYMVASSFNCSPGIPVLHSKNLIGWEIIGHVYDRLPFEKYDKPVHGQGSWAPSIRYNKGYFYVYFCTPHEGLFMAKTDNPAGVWELTHVAQVEMWEDPCPLWDDDGNAYLVRSKLCGEPLILHRLSVDGKHLLDNGTEIYNNIEEQPVLEGPKFMKKDGWYYILAPAGGVPTGWQTVLRSKNIYGPYETKIVLHQGNTLINGPHQGGLVDTKSGEWWVVHFQDRDAYGRIVHLQPVNWIDGWPLMGIDQNADGIGEPVMQFDKPNIPDSEIHIPQTSDEFETNVLGLQWQWHANMQSTWYSLTANPGHLRLFAVQNLSQQGNFWFVPNLLLQKFPAPSFQAETRVNFTPESPGDKCGLTVMGEEWAFLSLENTDQGMQLNMGTGKYQQCRDQTVQIASVSFSSGPVWLRVRVHEDAACEFAYSFDGEVFNGIGPVFQARKGRWIGAKVGLFCLHSNMAASQGYADFDWFRIE